MASAAKNGQQLERNESCCNIYHQSLERILAKLWIEPTTSCCNVWYAAELWGLTGNQTGEHMSNVLYLDIAKQILTSGWINALMNAL